MSEGTDVSEDQRILGGRYLVGEFIGQGGMSTVYRGVDQKLGRQVAIKVMKSNLAGDPLFRDRFRQEAQSASRMAHPTIVRVFDAGDDLVQTTDGPQTLPYIVMEYVEGKNVRQILSEGELSQTESCRIMDSVLTALEYSHRAGIVHRDIKPANIMITKTGQVKVMDFGIARAVSETSSTVAQTTAILGTAAYFSPEQAKGETVDARTDLYSAGVVLFEMLTGGVPFRGDSAVAVAYQHVSERPVPPSDRNPEVSAALDRVVLHSLAKDRAKRFQSAAEFRSAVKEAAAGGMPRLTDHGDHVAMMFSGGEEASESDLAIRQLAENSSAVRTQNRPPVMWTWAAILSVAVVIVAVIFWLMNLAPRDIQPQNTREIPDLVGTNVEEATAALRDLDLIVVPKREQNAEVPANEVISTDPEAGTSVMTDTTVTLIVSQGPAEAAVPDLSRMSLEEATEAIEKLGLKIGMTTPKDDPVLGENTVLEFTPEAGTTLPAGGVVDLVLSTGLVTVPDVQAQSLASAQEALERLNLLVSPQPIPDCPQAPDSPVQNQSPVGQSPQGSTVTLSYCSG
ncbi:Stk1 family PASTA domain-containing Ser/Thr kinase [Leucobacter sp. M11]|uniref:Stk1 family PASTA domain-containing Ser/Thr kinase n=1 Tax=Leucobacter sp. M11 TaxID=2993565 RepID=UPI002D7E9474|nr:Stk1 family PASTA domain-containing Ser/Thr kinase [Leucobacter sp. M11]MEB4614911.1 Stk1 family PASTA domain-containing Ser/Thr kinase [Leucobacter sp. M11]